MFIKFIRIGRNLNIPFFIIILSYSHFKKITCFEKNIEINSFIKKNSIKIEENRELKKIKAKLQNHTIYLNPVFQNEYEEILKHEIFHFLEYKYKISTFKILSETCARIYSEF